MSGLKLMIELNLVTEEDTQALAEQFSRVITEPMSCFLEGEIGAGKTAFVRHLLKALGVKGAIKSPTFSVVETYDLDGKAICHVDLYRISDEEELEYIGFKEMFAEAWLVLIEWPEKAPGLPTSDMTLSLSFDSQNRRARLESNTNKGMAFLNKLTLQAAQ